jgi:hypothetical protein
MNAANEPWMPQRKETEMKGHYEPSIVCAVLLFGAVLVSPAFADMKKVDETELAKANASVTGVSIKEAIASVDKNTVLWENDPRQNTTERVFSPAVNKATEAINLNLNISGQETFNFYFERGNSTITAGLGVTPAKH